MNNKNIIKIDIIKDLSKNTGFSNNFSKKLIDDLINVLIIQIKNGSLNLKNFGSFKLRSKKERLGRNPKTKKEHLISSRKSIIFVASSKILNMLD